MTRNVRPVGLGHTEVGASVGGPLFTNLGSPLPVPLTAIVGRHGLTDKTDLDFALHVPVVRAVGIDAGVAHLWWGQDGGIPALMGGGRLYLFGNALGLIRRTDPNTQKPYELNLRLFEELYGTLSWELVPPVVGWVGLSLFGQIEQAIVRPSLYAGVQWHVTPRLSLGLEAKWLAFLSDSSNLTVEYINVVGHGAVAVQLGVAYKFGDDL